MPVTDRVGGARRILVYGVTGSGKSTLARTLGDVLDLPVTSVDDVTWSPGWVSMPTDEQVRHFDALTRGDSWILDSAYSTWRDLVMDRADLVVALDYPRVVSLARLLRRTAVRISDGQEICNGNHETLRGSVFARDAIIWWHFDSFRRKRREMRRRAASPTGPAVVLLARPRDAAAFVERTRAEASGTGRVTS